jgi:hypothetical protein
MRGPDAFDEVADRASPCRQTRAALRRFLDAEAAEEPLDDFTLARVFSGQRGQGIVEHPDRAKSSSTSGVGMEFP